MYAVRAGIKFECGRVVFEMVFLGQCCRGVGFGGEHLKLGYLRGCFAIRFHKINNIVDDQRFRLIGCDFNIKGKFPPRV